MHEGSPPGAILNLEVVTLGTRNNRLTKMLAVGIIFILICSLVGCGRAQRKPQMPGKTQVGQKSKPPRELTQIQSGLERIYTALKPLQPGTAEQMQRLQRGGQGGGRGKQQGGQKEGGQGGKSAPSPSEQIDWAKLHQQSVRLHEQWNAFEPNAMKSGANPDAVDGFEGQLNVLSNKLAARDRYGSQLAANNAASFLPDFIQLYDGKAPPDLLRLRCLARDVVLKVEAGDWAGAESDLGTMPAVWSRVRTNAKGVKESDASRIQYAITDLRDSVRARDKIVVMLKEDILEKNIDALNKSLQRQF